MQLKEQIKDELLDKGLTIASWSKKNNFNKLNVYTIIDRYSSEKYGKPKSAIVYKIIKAIKKDTGVSLIKIK